MNLIQLYQTNYNALAHNPNNETLYDVINTLRDMEVFVPWYFHSEEDAKTFNSLAIKDGQTITLDEDLIMSLDTVKDPDGNEFFPVFTSLEEKPADYHYNTLNMDFIQAVFMSLDDPHLMGIVVNPFTKPFTFEKDQYNLLGLLPGVVEHNEEDPIVELINRGCDFYNKDNLEDYIKAETIFLQASQIGVPEAYSNLGYIYMYGKSGKLDRALGFEYFKKAADKGNLDGLMKVADDYQRGEFNPKDEALAFDMYHLILSRLHTEQDCNQHCEVFFRLAKCYAYGLGTPINYPYAMKLLEYTIHYMEPQQDVWYYQKQIPEAKKLWEKCYHLNQQDYQFKPMDTIPLNSICYIGYRVNRYYEGAFVIASKNANDEVILKVLAPATYTKEYKKAGKKYTTPRFLQASTLLDYGYLDMTHRLNEQFIHELLD